jgi:frataxin-like iron-binding protein CyaY
MNNKISDNKSDIQALKEKYAINGIYLSENTLALLIENQMVVIPNEQHDQFPLKPSNLKEGVHYNVISGKWVFSEFYHLLRGHCCKNGCRHCVYGPKKLTDIL